MLPDLARDHILDDDLPGLASRIVAEVPPAAWLGWSMGGLITLQALLDHGARMHKAILVSSNPSFVVRPHWPDGVEESLFIDFAHQLKLDFEGTLNRFLVLETLGSDTARETLRELREDLHSGPMPEVHALRAGLSVLRNTDYSHRLADMAHDMLWIAGGRDRLVPPNAIRRAAERVQQGRYLRVRGAGHAPFIGHRETFVDAIRNFLGEASCH